MFNKLALKLLLKENTRLRAQLRRSEMTVAELIDKFVHNRQPARLNPSPQANIIETTNNQTSVMSDAVSVAEADAAKRAFENNSSYSDYSEPV